MSYWEKSILGDIEIHKSPQTMIINRKKGFSIMGICEIGGGFNHVQNIIIDSSKGKKYNESDIRARISHLLQENELQGNFALIKHAYDRKETCITRGKVTAITFPRPVPKTPVTDDLEMISFNNYDDVPWSLQNIIIINEELEPEMLLKCFKECIELKYKILEGKGIPFFIRNSISDEDSILVASLHRDTASNLGRLDTDKNFEKEFKDSISYCMSQSCEKALDDAEFSIGIMDYISYLGVSVEDLVEAGMELCVGVEATPQLKEKLAGQILNSLSDINVITLIMAGIRVEEDFKLQRLREVRVDDDPAYLYSDEILGMAIANQIAGTKAIFNFKRYDELKPGIISNLGPMVDDVFAGLLAGCMSKIFEE